MTEKQQKVIELRKQGKGYDKIGNVLGINKCYVREICKKFEYDGVKASYTKVCPICKKIFTSEIHNKITCDECKKLPKKKYCKKCGIEISGQRQYCEKCSKKEPVIFNKKCETCGKIYITNRKEQRFCSKECRQISISALHEERECKCCGKTFITSTAKQVFCSKKCQHKENNYKYKSCNRDLMRQGNRFTTDQAYIDRVNAFTSKFEYIGCNGNDGEAYFYLLCKDCGAIKLRTKQGFKPSRAKKTALVCANCSKIIRDAKKRKEREEKELKQREREALKEQRKREEEQARRHICLCCGTEFTGKPNQKYCSKKCCNKMCYSNKQHTRRVRMYKNKSDKISLELLVKRDKCKCWICGKKIDYKDYEVRENGAFIAGLNYPSIDHVVPLSKGGAHTWDNVKLAHRHCNTKKSNEMYFEGKNGQIMFSV